MHELIICPSKEYSLLIATAQRRSDRTSELCARALREWLLLSLHSSGGRCRAAGTVIAEHVANDRSESADLNPCQKSSQAACEGDSAHRINDAEALLGVEACTENTVASAYPSIAVRQGEQGAYLPTSSVRAGHGLNGTYRILDACSAIDGRVETG